MAGQDLGDFALDADDRDVQRAAAQVVDHDGVADVGVHPVGEAGGGRLVDDPHHLQPGQLARLAGGVALGVGEVGRHGDDRLLHRLASAAPPPTAPARAGSARRSPAGVKVFSPSVTGSLVPISA